MKHPGVGFVVKTAVKIFSMSISSVAASLALLVVSAAPSAQASPPPSPITYPGCEKILQKDGVWIGSVCPEQIWTNSVPYLGVAVYYFGFLASVGDRVDLHFRVDDGQEHRLMMTRDTGVYFDVYNRNLFQARYIPYVPARRSVDLEVFFSRQSENSVQLHDEYGQRFKIRLKM